MWETYHEWDTTIYRFFLNKEEIAYIEEVYEWVTKKKNYFGFVLGKDREHYPLKDVSLDNIKIKVIVKAKELGWPIKEWPIKE